MKPVFGDKQASSLAYWIAQPGNLDRAIDAMRVGVWAWPHDCPAKSHEELAKAIQSAQGVERG